MCALDVSNVPTFGGSIKTRLMFPPNAVCLDFDVQTKKTISVNVVDNDIPEPDVNFLVHLSRPHKLLEGCA